MATGVRRPSSTRRAFLLAGAFVLIALLPDGPAAFGVGPLLDHGVTLFTVYALSAIIALIMGFASFGVTRAEHEERLPDTAPLPQ
jgi:hypothetical protein